MVETLLPDPTPLERAVSETQLFFHPGDVDVIRRVFDPEPCPDHMLPWLAHHMGVDLWFDDWSVEKKRAVIGDIRRLQGLKGTVAGVRGYLDLVDVPVTYITAPPVHGYLGEFSDETYLAWLAKLPQLRLYPYLGEGPDEGYLDSDILLDDEDDATSFGFDTGLERQYELPRVWRNGAETDLDLLNWSPRFEAGRKIDSVQVAMPVETLSEPFDEASLDDVLFHSKDVFEAGVVTVDLTPVEVIGSNSFDVAPAAFSLSLETTAYENVFEETDPLEDERFLDADLVLDDEGPLLGEDTGRFYVYRRSYLFDPLVAPPSLDGDLCFDDHIWDFTQKQMFVGVDTTEPIPDGDESFCWDHNVGGYFGEPDTTLNDRAVEAVRAAQGGTDVVIVDTQKFKPLTFGDAPKLDGSIKVGQMTERNFA